MNNYKMPSVVLPPCFDSVLPPNNDDWKSIDFPNKRYYSKEELYRRILRYNPDCYKQNTSKSVTYFKNVLYSYNEPIAFFIRRTSYSPSNPLCNPVQAVLILGKNARFGDYYSNTTSIHISQLITQCKLFNITFVFLDSNSYKQITEKNSAYKKLKTEYQIIKDKTECAVCLNKDRKVKIKLDCGHIFHKTCIKKWFKTKGQNECPLCKQLHIGNNNGFDFKDYLEENYC